MSNKTQVVSQLVAGGTASRLTGGKFANGALGAAFNIVVAGVVQGYQDWKNGQGTLYGARFVKGELKVFKIDVITGERVFVNGMLNDAAKYAASLGMYQSGGKSFTLFYNPSNGIIADLTESVLGKLTGTSSISRQFATYLKGSGVRELIAHSQGAIIAANAMRALATDGESLSGVKVTFNGEAVNYSSAGKVVRSVGGRMTPTSSDNIHAFDAVPNIAGFNTANPFKILGSILMLPTLFMGPEISQHTVYTP